VPGDLGGFYNFFLSDEAVNATIDAFARREGHRAYSKARNPFFDLDLSINNVRFCNEARIFLVFQDFSSHSRESRMQLAHFSL